jgi:HK97 family phage portal protein
MPLLDTIATALGYRKVERRSSLENPSTPLSYPAEWLLDIFNGGRTDSGMRVSEMTALQVSTVLACVQIISNGVSSLPLHVYERLVRDGRLGKKIAHTHSLYDLLHCEPNDEMSSATWIQTLLCHALLWGNHYSEIQRSSDDNAVLALWPHNPTRCRPVRLLKEETIEGEKYPQGTLVYEISEAMIGGQITPTDSTDDKTLTRRIVLAENVIHIHGLSLDGRVGQDTVSLARQAIGLALATEKYGSKLFGNGAMPRGILSTPGVLEPKAAETLKRSWSEAHGGENSHKTAVLEQGLTFTKIACTPEEAQNLETRKFQRVEIANVFGVPARMVDGDEHAARSTAEQSAVELLNYCLHPWINRIEHELKRKLFPKVGRSSGKYFPKFDTRQLLYPDATSRSTFYGNGKQWGYLTTNDIREMEGLNPVEDGTGDRLWMPVNEQYADDPISLGAKALAKHQEENPPAENNDDEEVKP